MFQLKMNLQITGEVDAVTLDKLEPMTPNNPLLAKVMRWVTESGFFEDKEEDYPLKVKRATSVIMMMIILLAAALVHRPARRLAGAPGQLAKWLFEPRSSPWFQALVEKKVFHRASHLAPALLICLAARFIFPKPDHSEGELFPYLATFQHSNEILWRIGLAYLAWVAMITGLAYVNACEFVFTGDGEEDNPVTRITRTAKRLVVLIGLVLIGSALADKNPMFFVGGLGALMAVLMLVFRGAILGLVASVQIVANKMVRIGDWIEVPTHNANGHVREMSLTTVKVRNFDKSISMIPMATLLSESFHNWSEMQRSGGRRIKRSIYIDVESIVPCTPEMVAEFEKIELLRDYLRDKKRDIEEDNKSRDTDASPVNSRRLTNIGTFRAYLEAYLETHPRLRTDFMHLVRQLQPCEHGLPIEISIFCRDTDWPTYEAIQADIFDHILSILPEFHLRAFQEMKSH
jgi:miniconductance mechanosensitive channel